jgi:hypothetical protein
MQRDRERRNAERLRRRKTERRRDDGIGTREIERTADRYTEKQKHIHINIV